jgi:predicted PurR-regulated permease PerM
MKSSGKYILGLLTIALAGLFVWFFFEIVVWILIALILSIMGRPMVNFLESIHIRKVRIPQNLAVFVSLFILILLFAGTIALLMPFLIHQTESITRLDYNLLSAALDKPIHFLEEQLTSLGVMTQDETLDILINAKLKILLQKLDLPTIAGSLVGIAGNLFIGIFSVLFMTFFFMKDEHLLSNAIKLALPEDYHDELDNILCSTRKLLSRYFIGICLEILTLTLLIGTGLYFLNIPKPFLIAFIAALLNIIPYLGVFIGSGIGMILAITSSISGNIQPDLMMIVLKIGGTVAACKLIDDILLQPMIYSSSVKAHPLEIFLVIMMAGSLAGIPGMIFAIPVYTFLRVVAKEFFKGSRLISNLTRNI